MLRRASFTMTGQILWIAGRPIRSHKAVENRSLVEMTGIINGYVRRATIETDDIFTPKSLNLCNSKVTTTKPRLHQRAYNGKVIFCGIFPRLSWDTLAFPLLAVAHWSNSSGNRLLRSHSRLRLLHRLLCIRRE